MAAKQKHPIINKSRIEKSVHKKTTATSITEGMVNIISIK